MTDESKINRTHKNVVGHMWHDDVYCIGFTELIYDNFKDFIAFSEIIPDVLDPEECGPFGGLEDMSGSFVKEGIRVDTWWTSLVDYFWEIHTFDEAVHKKVYEWGAAVYDEYVKRHKDKPLSESFNFKLFE
ncbi:MAG: hypothetical protein J1F11_02235 [Oscillospiraceae bacterium]|nr:hypothetical protein [Oscillospiraceae bacterium]